MSASTPFEYIYPYSHRFLARMNTIRDKRESSLEAAKRDVINSRAIGSHMYGLYTADKSKLHISERRFSPPKSVVSENEGRCDASISSYGSLLSRGRSRTRSGSAGGRSRSNSNSTSGYKGSRLFGSTCTSRSRSRSRNNSTSTTRSRRSRSSDSIYSRRHYRHPIDDVQPLFHSHQGSLYESISLGHQSSLGESTSRQAPLRVRPESPPRVRSPTVNTPTTSSLSDHTFSLLVLPAEYCDDKRPTHRGMVVLRSKCTLEHMMHALEKQFELPAEFEMFITSTANDSKGEKSLPLQRFTVAGGIVRGGYVCSGTVSSPSPKALTRPLLNQHSLLRVKPLVYKREVARVDRAARMQRAASPGGLWVDTSLSRTPSPSRDRVFQKNTQSIEENNDSISAKSISSSTRHIQGDIRGLDWEVSRSIGASRQRKQFVSLPANSGPLFDRQSSSGSVNDDGSHFSTIASDPLHSPYVHEKDSERNSTRNTDSPNSFAYQAAYEQSRSLKQLRDSVTSYLYNQDTPVEHRYMNGGHQSSSGDNNGGLSSIRVMNHHDKRHTSVQDNADSGFNPLISRFFVGANDASVSNTRTEGMLTYTDLIEPEEEQHSNTRHRSSAMDELSVGEHFDSCPAAMLSSESGGAIDRIAAVSAVDISSTSEYGQAFTRESNRESVVRNELEKFLEDRRRVRQEKACDQISARSSLLNGVPHDFQVSTPAVIQELPNRQIEFNSVPRLAARSTSHRRKHYGVALSSHNISSNYDVGVEK
mmetsp:Transcript_20919/g.30127  ORF Transcript_20919/g.30127 Transcript_20919/m.30127 type:complete len:760 (-) Transcript_20919:280-2559(-)